MRGVTDYTRALHAEGLVRHDENAGALSAHLVSGASRRALELASEHNLTISHTSRTMANVTDRDGTPGVLVYRHWTAREVAEATTWLLGAWDTQLRTGGQVPRAFRLDPPATGLEDALTRLASTPAGGSKTLLEQQLPSLGSTYLESIVNMPFNGESPTLGYVPATRGADEITTTHLVDLLRSLGAEHVWIGHFAPMALSGLIRRIANDPTLLRRSKLLEGPTIVRVNTGNVDRARTR